MLQKTARSAILYILPKHSAISGQSTVYHKLLVNAISAADDMTHEMQGGTGVTKVKSDSAR